MEIIVSDGDIGEMFHPALEWRECDDEIKVGWKYSNGEFSPPPPPSEEELISIAASMKSQLMGFASEMIAPLQDAVDLEEATDEEIRRLNAWKQYRVNLNRIEGQVGYPATIEWPVAPG